jgi:hypothetical protein
MNKTKVTIGPITLNVWDDFYGAPNRVSPTRELAAGISAAENASMITVPIAKAIFAQASLKIKAQPLGAGTEREMRAKLAQHNTIINSKIPAGFSGLVDGHMKNLVLSEKLRDSKAKDANIVIWGWWKGPGLDVFWQPEFGGHYAGWADYAQGLRLADRVCWVNGVEKDLHDLYKDIQYSVFLTVSGQPLKRVTYQ